MHGDSVSMRWSEERDIVEVIGEHIQLRKVGREFKGLCPFHNEKSASFWVSPEKQFYHCFGCGAHGDAEYFVKSLAARGGSRGV